MLLSILAVAVLSSLPPQCNGVVRHTFDEHDFGETLGAVIILHVQYEEVRSQPSGDTSKAFKLDECRRLLSRLFYSSEGVEYLRKEAAPAADDAGTNGQVTLAILEVLYESHQPSAVAVLESFTKNKNKIVAGRARSYLRRLSKNTKPK
jgi:hypothetical protein